MEVRFETGSEPICLDVRKNPDAPETLSVRDARGGCLQVHPLGDGWFQVRCPDSRTSHNVRVVSDGSEVFAAWNGGEATLQVASGLSGRNRKTRGPRAQQGESSGDVRAPMPGTIISVEVAEGDSIAQGDHVMALEAMKMEHQLRAPASGRITKVHVSQGDQVDGGAVLVEIEPAESEAT